jgi:transposase InsO family protein
MASSTGIKELHIPPQSPDLNAICERFIGSLRRECLDHMLIVNERQLHKRVKAYVLYLNQAQPHQGIGQRPPDPNRLRSASATGSLKVTAHPVLGGLHHDYRRAA